MEADDETGTVEEVKGWDGTYIRRRVDETDVEFSKRVAAERGNAHDNRHVGMDMSKALHPVKDCFERLWSHLR